MLEHSEHFCLYYLEMEFACLCWWLPKWLHWNYPVSGGWVPFEDQKKWDKWSADNLACDSFWVYFHSWIGFRIYGKTFPSELKSMMFPWELKSIMISLKEKISWSRGIIRLIWTDLYCLTLFYLLEVFSKDNCSGLLYSLCSFSIDIFRI